MCDNNEEVPSRKELLEKDSVAKSSHRDSSDDECVSHFWRWNRASLSADVAFFGCLDAVNSIKAKRL